METNYGIDDTRPNIWLIVPTKCNPPMLVCDTLVHKQLNKESNPSCYHFLYIPERAHTPSENIAGVKKAIEKLKPTHTLAILTYGPITIRSIEVFAAYASIADKVRKFTFENIGDTPEVCTNYNTRLVEIDHSEPFYEPYAHAFEELETLTYEL